MHGIHFTAEDAVDADWADSDSVYPNPLADAGGPTFVNTWQFGFGP